MKQPESFVKLLKMRRLELGFETQKKMAKAKSVDHPMLSRWESGAVLPKLKRSIERVARLYQLPIEKVEAAIAISREEESDSITEIPMSIIRSCAKCKTGSVSINHLVILTKMQELSPVSISQQMVLAVLKNKISPR